MKDFVLLLVAATVAACHALMPSTYLDAHDLAQLNTLFSKHLAVARDLPSVHYAAVGLQKLKTTIQEPNRVCEYVKKSVVSDDLASIYMATRTASILPSCKLDLPSSIVQFVKAASSGDKSSVQDMYHAVETLGLMGGKIDSGAISRRLLAALKVDETVLSLGYSFHIASHLSTDVGAFVERIEDAIIQADEVDSKYLQYDGGVGITSIILTGVYKLSHKAGKMSGLSQLQAVKFANYLVNRKTVQSVKAASHLAAILAVFADNEFHVPLVASLHSPVVTRSVDTDASLAVRVTDVLGGAAAGGSVIAVTADSVTRHSDGAVVVSQRPFTASSDGLVFVMSDTQQQQQQQQAATTKRHSGFYTAVVTVQPQQPPQQQQAQKKKDKSGDTSAAAAAAVSRLIGGSVSVRVSVVTQVQVQRPTLALVDADFSQQQQQLPSNSHQLHAFEQLSGQLSADESQRLMLSFRLTDVADADRPLKCHQVFVRLEASSADDRANTDTRAVTVVVTPDEQSNYHLDLPLSKHVRRLSPGGSAVVLRVVLAVGDASIDNSFLWPLAQLRVKTAASSGPSVDAASVPDIYAVMPEIKHMFRTAEPRPSSTVSSVFTALVLLPTLLMLMCWLRIGTGFSLPCVSLASVGFVLGIAGIFTLYFYFWLQLNMFVTIKYLCGLALVTFLCGHSALSGMAARRCKSACQ